MKKHSSLFACLLLMSIVSYSQNDTIITKGGQIICCTISELAQSSVMYYIIDNNISISKTIYTDSIKYLSSNRETTKDSWAIIQKKLNITSGSELILFSKHIYTGIVLSTIGTGAIIGSTFMNTDAQKAVLYGGIALNLIGIIFTLESFSHVRKAGEKLNKVLPISTESGIGIGLVF